MDIQERGVSFVLYLEVALILIVLLWRRGNRKGVFYAISRWIFGFTLLFYTLWIVWVLTQSEYFYAPVILISLVLAPLLFLIFIIFLIYYGVRTILQQDTYFKVFGILKQEKGLRAIYLGLVLIAAGIFLFFFWLGAMSIFGCKDNNVFCRSFSSIEQLTDASGKVLEILIKPLQWLGLVGRY